ncbi:hypothetical protein L1987_06430 [Smallanthus sonchifolius]|uniref:Uncharacterized protein n=1 Tax=Smallanthus sonchifolius TaxID=185202 RepID=A0ACB9JY92_9ASTR|nr:hypothetical protein L1987_06430 [Smallanthus sonchifolius]
MAGEDEMVVGDGKSRQGGNGGARGQLQATIIMVATVVVHCDGMRLRKMVVACPVCKGIGYNAAVVSRCRKWPAKDAVSSVVGGGMMAVKVLVGQCVTSVGLDGEDEVAVVVILDGKPKADETELKAVTGEYG